MIFRARMDCGWSGRRGWRRVRSIRKSCAPEVSVLYSPTLTMAWNLYLPAAVSAAGDLLSGFVTGLIF